MIHRPQKGFTRTRLKIAWAEYRCSLAAENRENFQRSISNEPGDWVKAAITHLVQAGVDLLTVKRISGHKTLAMVERYSHKKGEHIRAAMNKLERHYRKLKG